MRALFATPMAALMATAGLILGASGPAAAMNISLDGGCTASSASVDGSGNVDITVSCPTTTPPSTPGLRPAASSTRASRRRRAGQSFTIYGKCTGGDRPDHVRVVGHRRPGGPTLIQSALNAHFGCLYDRGQRGKDLHVHGDGHGLE